MREKAGVTVPPNSNRLDLSPQPCYKVDMKQEHSNMKPQIRLDKITKVTVCGGGAFAISLLLFYFMSTLISNTEDLRKPEDSAGLIEFTRVKPRSFLDEKKRTLPKKKPKHKKPPKMQKLADALPPVQKMTMNMELPDIKSILRSGGPAVGGLGGAGLGSGALPLVRVDPIYPRRAAMQGIEGYVLFQFNITPKGTVSDIKILDARPPRIFNRSAIQAIRKWKYRPKMEDGKPVMQYNQRTQVDFSLE